MTQVLHIFKKDTRRFWLEILGSFVALAIYVLNYPARWNVRFPSPYMYLQVNDNMMIFVVVAAWWLVIARVIHAESLVGESTFWRTRPYNWKSLMAAKLLFICVWIYIPFVIAQMLVLVQSGFSPLSGGRGWLLMLALYSGVFIVPLLMLAAMTANLARMALVAFGSYLAAIACYLWFSSRSETRAVNMYSQGYRTTVPHTHYFLVVIIALVGGAVVVLLQYALRRAWVSRGVAIGVAVLAVGSALAISKMPQSEVSREYPAVSPSELQLAFVPSHSNPMWVGLSRYEARVQLPIDLSGVPEGSAVQVDNMQFSIDGADGTHWTGPWRRLNTTPFLPGTHSPSLPVILSRKDYEHFNSAPVTLHVTLALTELRASRATTAIISSPDFAVSGFGVCSSEWQGEPRQFLLCRSEFGELPLTYITAPLSPEPCPGGQPQPGEQLSFGALAGRAYPDPVDDAWEPVRITYTESEAYDRRHQPRDPVLCPGTLASFTRYDVVRRSRSYLTLPNFRLPLPKQWLRGSVPEPQE